MAAQQTADIVKLVEACKEYTSWGNCIGVQQARDKHKTQLDPPTVADTEHDFLGCKIRGKDWEE